LIVVFTSFAKVVRIERKEGEREIYQGEAAWECAGRRKGYRRGSCCTFVEKRWKEKKRKGKT